MISTYLIATFLIVPYVAPIFGREKIKNSEFVSAHTIFTTLCNRNYVNPSINKVLEEIAIKFQRIHSGVKLVYLDANFPFIDGFPLPPHLSHNDGNKIDISFIYTDKRNDLTNKKPSVLGYGTFVPPKKNEYNQIQICENKGYWQYDIAKYLTMGISNNKLKFSEKATKNLLLTILKRSEVRKVFIEPHLKQRLGLSHPKLRFHGCQAVRHDDHIHIQL